MTKDELRENVKSTMARLLDAAEDYTRAWMAHQAEVTLLTDAEVERLFRWMPGKAEAAARDGKLRSVILPDGQIRFRQSDVDAIISGGECSTALPEAARGA